LFTIFLLDLALYILWQMSKAVSTVREPVL